MGGVGNTRIKKYFDPTPNIIVQRFKFAKRLQMPNETISEFITALKKIAEKCEFPDVEDRLRDALVCGILSEEIQSMLLMNSMLTFKVAQEMALAHEAAVRNVAEIKDGKPQEEINVMGRAVKVRRRNEKIFKCFRCGYTNHREEQCFFKEKRCFKCQKLGHISRVCKNGNWRSDRNNNCSIDEEAEATNGLFNINQVKDTSNMRNYMVKVRTSGRDMNMLIDSGTRKNIISEKTYIRTWVKSERPRIEKDYTKLVQWNRQRLSILGKIKADVKVNKRSITMEFLVIEGPGPNLIGREAFDQIGIGLEWMNYGDSVCQINEVMNGNGMAAAMNGNGKGMAAAMNGTANGMMSGANGMGAGYMNGGEGMYSEGDGLSVYGNPGVDFPLFASVPRDQLPMRTTGASWILCRSGGTHQGCRKHLGQWISVTWCSVETQQWRRRKSKRTMMNIEQFNPNNGNEISSYLERFESYCIANDIVKIVKKKATFFSLCGRETYNIIRTLTSPKNPLETEWEEIVAGIKKYFDPTPNIIVQRFKFAKRLQMPNETISEFITALKKIAEKCEFPDVEDRLRDALVCGILSEEIQSMLLMNSMLTFKVAQEMALAHEAAVRNVAEIKDGKPQEEINVMGRAVKTQQWRRRKSKRTMMNIEQFNPNNGNEISSYLERFESYCIANDIVKIVKKKATFFSLCGRETYNIIRTLTSPKNPLETEWEEIVAGIKKYFDPTPNIIVQRFKFAKRLQMPNETISEFITALKKIAEKCEFPDVEDRLRDALVCGILSEEIQSMLLMNSMLTFKVAQEMALAHEAAVRNVAEIKDGKPQEEINVMGRAVKVRRRNEKIFKCFRCGYTNHREEQCFFKEKRCFKCQKLGHISRVCKNGNWRSDRNNNCSIDEEAEATNGLFNINQVKDTSNMRNYMVKVRTSGRDMNMLIDSGTRKNIISEKTYIRTWVKSERPRIEKDYTKLVQWNRQRLSVLGKIKADVKVNKRSITMEFLVIEGPGPNLIGREAFDQIGIGLEWMNYGDSVCQINEVMNGNGMAAAMNGNGKGMAAAMNGTANGMMSGANGMGAGYMNGGEGMYSEGDGLSVYGNPGVDFPLFASVPRDQLPMRTTGASWILCRSGGTHQGWRKHLGQTQQWRRRKSKRTMMNIEQFNPNNGNEISSYLERFESYCIANDIVKIVKKKATFFSLCGRETYNIIRTLTSPKNPLETEWEEIVAGIKKYFDPTPNIIVQRFKFAKRLQMPNETISEFITALKKIAEKCEFPDVEDRLRDALVCGILNREIQSMLLMNSMLTFKVAQEMALAHEAAVRNVAEIKDGKPQEEINVMGRAVK
ncbi:hypothetical protein LAZ67_2001524, partial [Cordylochernes scorpioides]